MVILSLVYPLYFAFNIHNQTNEVLVFGLLLMLTSLAANTYGQFLFSWDSTYFDFVESRKGDGDFLKSKHKMLMILLGICTAFFVPWIVLHPEKYLWLSINVFLYNSCIGVYLILYAGTLNKKRLEIGQRAMMNYQGVSFYQFFLVLPLILLPMAVFWAMSFIPVPYVARSLFGIFCGIGFLMRKKIFAFLEKSYSKRKYERLAGFRNDHD